MKHGSLSFRLVETDVQFREICQGVCFAKADRMLFTVYIKVDDETAIGVNQDGSLRLEPEELVNVVRLGDAQYSEHYV